MMRADRSLAYSHQQQKNNKSDNNPSKIIALRCSRLFIAMSTHTLYSDQNGKSIFPLTCWERYLRAEHLCRLSPCVYIRSDMAEQQTSYKECRRKQDTRTIEASEAQEETRQGTEREWRHEQENRQRKRTMLRI